MGFPGYKTGSFSANAAIWTAVSTVLLAFALPGIGSAADKTAPTFTKDVAPILFENCAKCHRTGGLAYKVQLMSYDMARLRAELIKQKVITREMPPWPADPAKSLRFRNDARLSQHEIDTIV